MAKKADGTRNPLKILTNLINIAYNNRASFANSINSIFSINSIASSHARKQMAMLIALVAGAAAAARADHHKPKLLFPIEQWLL